MMLFEAMSNSKSAQNNHSLNQSLRAICLCVTKNRVEKYTEQQI